MDQCLLAPASPVTESDTYVDVQYNVLYVNLDPKIGIVTDDANMAHYECLDVMVGGTGKELAYRE